jgi:hypothetical protein
MDGVGGMRMLGKLTTAFAAADEAAPCVAEE